MLKINAPVKICATPGGLPNARRLIEASGRAVSDWEEVCRRVNAYDYHIESITTLIDVIEQLLPAVPDCAVKGVAEAAVYYESMCLDAETGTVCMTGPCEPTWRDRPTRPGKWLSIGRDCLRGHDTVLDLTQDDLDRGSPFHSEAAFGPIPERNEQ